MDKYKYGVSVRCFTYNHSAYIKDTLNGFCIQKTNFPFVCAIMDDASTDGEPEIIKNYLLTNFELADRSIVIEEETNDFILLFARHKYNVNCHFAIFLLKYNHYRKKPKLGYLSRWQAKAKYHALCEGDDYWIDPLKLQKQVDFLEENPSYNMVYTKYKENHNGVIKDGTWPLLDGDCIKQYLLRKGFIPTASVLYRSSFTFDFDYKKKNFPLGDAPLWIQLMHSSPIKLLPDVTTVYRILDESVSHSKSYIHQIKFLIGALQCRKYFADKYGYNDVSQILEKEIKTYSLLLELYQGNYKTFLSGKPWKYNIGIRGIIGVLKNKYNDKNHQ